MGGRLEQLYFLLDIFNRALELKKYKQDHFPVFYYFNQIMENHAHIPFITIKRKIENN